MMGELSGGHDAALMEAVPRATFRNPEVGALKGKIGIVSDAHGNTAGVERAVRVLRRAGAAEIFSLGDSVGYIPGAAVLDFFASEGISSLKGNHEAMAAEEIGYLADAERLYRAAEVRELLGDARLTALRNLPHERKFATAAGSVLMCHASPDDLLLGYVYPDTPLEEIERSDFDIVFMGHTHRPFDRMLGGKRFVNIGSCGQPRDHGALGSACLFDADSGEVSILRFDIRAETEAILAAAGLSRGYLSDLLQRRPTDPLVGTFVND